MTTWLDEGRAPVVIDYAYHNIHPIRTTVSGLVNISSDIEIGAVEIKDSITNDRARVIAPTDAVANDNAMYTVAFTMGWDTFAGGNVWQRIRAAYPDWDTIDREVATPGLSTVATMFGKLDHDSLRIVEVTSDGQMKVVVSGLNVDVELGAVEIKDAVSESRATVTAEYGLEVDITIGLDV